MAVNEFNVLKRKEETHIQATKMELLRGIKRHILHDQIQKKNVK
jgi:hypothetical protein